MMCFEVSDSPVEGESEQPLAHHTEQLNLEVINSEVTNSEVTNLEVTNLEAQLEQSLSLQDWLNRESQLHMTENQLHMNEVRLKQLSGTTQDDLLGRKGHGVMNQKHDDINSKNGRR